MIKLNAYMFKKHFLSFNTTIKCYCKKDSCQIAKLKTTINDKIPLYDYMICKLTFSPLKRRMSPAMMMFLSLNTVHKENRLSSNTSVRCSMSTQQ